MNHTYRLIWNDTAQCQIPVPENARSRGKRTSVKPLAAALLTAFTCTAQALPSGGTVTAGSGTVATSGSTMTVTQTSQNLAVNWQSFNIGASDTVNFVQPNASAIALNRVLGTNGTQILGKLNANGQVWILNPNGVLFGQTAQVNVGGLVASTLGMSDADFMAGKRTLTGNGGNITNRGEINANYVALLGEQVKNEGVIVANLGTVALAAGNTVTLDFAGDKLLGVQIDEGALHALVDNKSLIQADGGLVVMTARAKDALLDTAVNNSGIVRARTLENRQGKILLLGDMNSGTTNVGGTLDASAPDSGDGGFIDTSAAKVGVGETAFVTTKSATGQTGTWLIDPVDFTIAASGGDMTGAAVTAALANNNLTIWSTNGGAGTAGDVNVNDSVTWSSHVLTLNAQNNININAQMNGSGTAGLALEYGQANMAAGNASTYNIRAPVNLASTGSFSTKLGSDGVVKNYAIITALGAESSNTGTDLQGMNGNLAGNYVLGADIDASATSGWNGGLGFQPIAPSDTGIDGFTGHFDGLGHIINGLTINRPDNTNIGLFGNANGATIANIGLTDVAITGKYRAGGVVGRGQQINISNSYVTGTVTAMKSEVGGVMGYDLLSSTFNNVYSTATVIGATPGDGTTLTSAGMAGGLLGGGWRTVIQNSYATGAVSGGNYVGGLIGRQAHPTGVIDNSYFSGTVTVIGTPYALGALVGENYFGTISNTYWNTDTAGSTAVGVGPNGSTNVAGLTTEQMRDAANFAGFTFTTTPGGSGWVLVGNDGALNGANGTVLPMLATEWSPVIRNAHQLQLMSMNLNASYTLANDIDASATNGGAHNVWLSSSFAPVGSSFADSFTGGFDGLGHTITGLTINRPGTSYLGLFGYSSGTLRNVGLVNSSISGWVGVGALAGVSNGTISYSYADGGTVTGGDTVGGLQGGGSGSIDSSYANISVTGGGNSTGGLRGGGSGAVSNSYATGSVHGTTHTGGLVGYSSGDVTNSYATGAVTATGANVGGLLGTNTGTVTNSFWDTQTTGQATSAGGAGAVGKTTAQMKQLATFTAWDIDDAGGTGKVWRIYEGYTNPLLRNFMTTLNARPDYDGSGAALGNVASYTITDTYDAGKVLGAAGSTLTLTSTAADAYTTWVKGLYSTQQGYDLVTHRTISTPGSAAGDIALSAPITWSSGTLAINTSGTITQTAAVSGTGTAIFDLQAGTWSQINGTLPGFSVYDFRISGGSFIRALSGNGTVGTPYQLADIYGMQGMGSSGMLGLNYTLANNVDASGTANWNGSAGFKPVGPSFANRFTGSFDGLGHTITGLTINRPGTSFIGLFGYSSGALRNVGLVNSSISGRAGVGALVGISDGAISDSYADGGTVTGDEGVGGLVGSSGFSSSISQSYANVSVTGGNTGTGGLVGGGAGTISNSYASGSVHGSIDTGGLVGQYSGNLSNSYATGAVSWIAGGSGGGGLVGNQSGGAVTNSFWDTQTSGQATSSGGAGAVGKTTAQMKQLATFAGWDIDDAGGTGKVWRIYEGNTAPLLRTFMTALTVTANNASKTYDGTAWNGGNGVSKSDPAAVLLGSASYSGSSQGATNAGSYTIVPGGLYSNQQGYDIVYFDGTLSLAAATSTHSVPGAPPGGYAGAMAYLSGDQHGIADTTLLASVVSTEGTAPALPGVAGLTIIPCGQTLPPAIANSCQ